MLRGRRVRSMLPGAGAAFVLTAMLLTAGCGTGRLTVADTAEKQTLTQEEGGVRATLTFLPKGELVRRFGEENNPFIPPEAMLSAKDFFVLEAVVTETPVPGGEKPYRYLTVLPGEMELHFSGKVDRPTNQFHFTNYWEQVTKVKDPREYSIERMTLTIKRTMLERENSTAGGPVRGLVVFRQNLPSYGEATVYLPVFDQDGRPVHRFSFVFSF
jgi:hypothetical protein